jgi:hypothetical protein
MKIDKTRGEIIYGKIDNISFGSIRLLPDLRNFPVGNDFRPSQFHRENQ